MSSPVSVASSARTALYLIAAGVCAALHIWKLAPALPVLQADLELNLVESGFLLSIVQLAGMTLGLLIGLMAERIGRRRCVLAGLGILAGSSLLSTVFSSAESMLLFRSIEGCGFLMVVLPVPSMFKNLLPPATLSRVMGVWSCYMPMGTILILISGAWMISVGGWRVLWLVLAVATLLMLVLILVMVPDDKAVAGPPRKGSSQTRQSALELLRQTLGSASVWLVALIFGAYAAQWMAVIGFLPTVYADADISGTLAGVLTGLVAGANIGGNLLAGQLLHRRVPALYLLLTGFTAMLICTVVAFGIGASIAVQFVSVFLFSAIGGLIPATCFVMAMRVAPSPQTTTMTVGWMQQGSALGQFSGPPVVAMIVNMAGGWQWTWAATAIYTLAGIVLALTLHRQARSATVS